MTQQSKLEWTEYKSRFRAVTAYGTYWVDMHAGRTSYQLICGTNPCCVMFSSPQEAKDYAQTIHDRPTSRDDWFNLSDVEQAPYHASLELPELLRTYETLLAGDNLPERIAVQTVDMRALLNAAKPVDLAIALNSAALIVEGRSTAVSSDFIHKLSKRNVYEIADLISESYLKLGAAIRDLSAEPTQGEQWQPIETAPKDGTVILAWHIAHKCPVPVLWKDGGFPYQGERLSWFERTYTTAWPERAFSYWMPLPTAPTTEAGK